MHLILNNFTVKSSGSSVYTSISFPVSKFTVFDWELTVKLIGFMFLLLSWIMVCLIYKELLVKYIKGPCKFRLINIITADQLSNSDDWQSNSDEETVQTIMW